MQMCLPTYLLPKPVNVNLRSIKCYNSSQYLKVTNPGLILVWTIFWQTTTTLKTDKSVPTTTPAATTTCLLRTRKFAAMWSMVQQVS